MANPTPMPVSLDSPCAYYAVPLNAPIGYSAYGRLGRESSVSPRLLPYQPPLSSMEIDASTSTVHDNPNAAPLAGRIAALEHMANVSRSVAALWISSPGVPS